MPLDASLPPPTILIVDDDAIVRRVIQGHLSNAGYRIFEAEDGQEALEVLARAGSVSLVIVDLVMPRLSGPGLLAELRRQRPSQPVLLMSAYPAERETLDDEQPAHPFLPKPFTRDQLLAKVAEASEARATEPT
ncbi:MAG TPA: response regulator [Gemmatimonadales bacterium]|nr:response regulator [Gemmatimonadales bacterium]